MERQDNERGFRVWFIPIKFQVQITETIDLKRHPDKDEKIIFENKI